MTDTPKEKGTCCSHSWPRTKTGPSRAQGTDCVQPTCPAGFALHPAFPPDSRTITLTRVLLQVEDQLCSPAQVQAHRGHGLQVFHGGFLGSLSAARWEIVLWKSVLRQTVSMLISQAVLGLFTHGILERGRSTGEWQSHLTEPALHPQGTHPAPSTANHPCTLQPTAPPHPKPLPCHQTPFLGCAPAVPHSPSLELSRSHEQAVNDTRSVFQDAKLYLSVP